MRERTAAYIPEEKVDPNVALSIDSLDDVLSDLKDSFQSLQDSICSICKQQITDSEKLQVRTKVNISLIFQFFHKSCFFCNVCKLEFGTEKPFIEFGGKFYCEKCHQQEVGAFCEKWLDF